MALQSKGVTGTKPTPNTTVDTAQQMALLQMYGVPTTVPGYMAMPAGIPYSMPEVHLQNLSFAPPPAAAPSAPFVDTARMLSVKPVTGPSPQVPSNSNFNLQMVNGVQLLPCTQSLPVAAILPNNLVQGSYVTPVPVIGNCVINPCQPGIMAAPWVR